MEENKFNKKKTIIISEEQYNKMFLAEDRHHPHFLDIINEKLSDEVIKTATETAKAYTANRSFVFNCENDIFQDLNVNISIETINGEEINNPKEYQSNFYSGILKDGKILNATINLWIPFTTDGLTNTACIRSVVSHEVMHLFDDHTSQKNGMPPISLQIRASDNHELMNNRLIKQNKIANEISVFIYISSTLERKAYLAQTMNELYRVGCNWNNYMEKMKETVPYRNFKLTQENINSLINKASHKEIVEAITIINLIADNANLPDTNTNKEEELRQKLLNWINGEYKKFIRKYAGTVLYFLENFSTTNDTIVR